MPDISMCQDAKCPSKNTCKRFASVPNQVQSYTDFKRKEKEPFCESYIMLRGGRNA
jgi:hypothetical protein